MHSNFVSKATVIASSLLVLSACNMEELEVLEASGESELVDSGEISTPGLEPEAPQEQPVTDPNTPVVVSPVDEEPPLVVVEPPIDEPVDSEPPTVVVEPVSPVTSPAFMFQVIDGNDGFITEIAAGDVIDIATLPELFNIEAVPMGTQFGSVSFEATGSNYSLARVEESPIWTLGASNEGFQAGEGTYTVAATGHSEDRTEGLASETAYITFTLMSSELPVTEPEPLPVVEKVVTELDITWQKPVAYTNGETLNGAEIAGYEILYRPNGSVSYTRVFVEGADNLATEVTVEGSGDFEFSIATVGTDGFYSAFSDPELVNL